MDELGLLHYIARQIGRLDFWNLANELTAEELAVWMEINETTHRGENSGSIP